MWKPSLSTALARAFLAGEPTVEQVTARAARVLGKPWRWLRPLARRYVKAFAGRARPRYREVVEFLLQDRGFLRAWSKYSHEISVGEQLSRSPEMQPIGAAAAWPVPAIESVPALADWLGLYPGELEWFADLRGLEYHRKTRPILRNYRYRSLTKLSGSIRLIEAPKPRLKELQRQILTRILEKIPPHPAAHGFIKGRSIRTFVASHVGQRVVCLRALRAPVAYAPALRNTQRGSGGGHLRGSCNERAPVEAYLAHRSCATCRWSWFIVWWRGRQLARVPTGLCDAAPPSVSDLATLTSRFRPFNLGPSGS